MELLTPHYLQAAAVLPLARLPAQGAVAVLPLIQTLTQVQAEAAAVLLAQVRAGQETPLALAQVRAIMAVLVSIHQRTAAVRAVAAQVRLVLMPAVQPVQMAAQVPAVQ